MDATFLEDYSAGIRRSADQPPSRHKMIAFVSSHLPSLFPSPLSTLKLDRFSIVLFSFQHHGIGDNTASSGMYRAAFRAAKTWLRIFLVVLAALLLGIDDTWITDLFSSFLGLRKIFDGSPVREKIIIAFNFLAMGVVLILSWRMNQIREKAKASEDLDPSPSSDCPLGSSAFFSEPSAPPMPKNWEEKKTPPVKKSGRSAKGRRRENAGSSFSCTWSSFPSPTAPVQPSAPPMRDWEPSDSFSSHETGMSLDSAWESIQRAPRLTKNKTCSSSTSREEAARGKMTTSRTSREHGTERKGVELQEQEELEMDRRYEAFIRKRREDLIREREESFRRQRLNIADLLNDPDHDAVTAR